MNIKVERPRLHPEEIAERRGRRFFGTASRPDYGISAGFERGGDPLWRAGDIAKRLADQMQGGARAIIERFKFSVQAGGFGPPASTGRFATPLSLNPYQRSRAETTRHLVDLDSAVLRPPEPGQYALRPSVLVAIELAPYMRARQSIWAWWIAAQGWSVPSEFVAPTVERNAEGDSAPRNTGGRPSIRREHVAAWYDALPKRDRARGSIQGLAESYVKDHGGSVDYVKKLLRKLRDKPG